MSNSTTSFKGNTVQLSGKVPAVGSAAPDFKIVGADLSEVSLSSFKGKKVILNTFPSVDTPVCATQLKQFSSKLGNRDDVVLLFASMDLPFAFGRFCAAEGVENAVTGSDFRFNEVGAKYGLTITDSVVKGLLARSVFVIDEEQTVVHAQLVPEITEEPDYDAALTAL